MNPTPSSAEQPLDRDELIRRHLPLAYRLAACYRSSGRSYEDLVQIAEIGLVRAADRFDPRTGVAFRPFATHLISAELGRSLRQGIGGPRRLAEHRVAKALGRGPRVGDLARRLDVERDVLAGALVRAAGREAVTLNLPSPRPGGRLDGVSVAPAAA